MPAWGLIRLGPLCHANAILRPGGALLLELGGDQAELLRVTLDDLGYAAIRIWTDEDGDLRGLEATFG